MTDQILVVDDDHDTANTLARLVTILGQNAKPAYSGPDAVKQSAILLPEMIFIDIGMPGMNGYETAKRIRRLPGGDRIILVALTGWAGEEDRRRAYECGFDLHVIKPMALETLQRLLAVLDPAEMSEAVPA